MVERGGVACSNLRTGQKPTKRSRISCIDCGTAYLKAGSEKISTRILKQNRTRRQRSFLHRNLELILRLRCTSLKPRWMAGSHFIFPWIIPSLPASTLHYIGTGVSRENSRNTHGSCVGGQNITGPRLISSGYLPAEARIPDNRGGVPSVRGRKKADPRSFPAA